MLEERVSTPADNYQVLSLSADDRYELIKLAAEVRVRSEELTMVRVRLDAARAISDAAGDSIVAKMGVPADAQDVSIDLNAGTVHYLLPPPANA